MHRQMIMALLLPCLLVSLTACVGDKPPTVVTRIQLEGPPEIPADKFECNTRPTVPAATEGQKGAAWLLAWMDGELQACGANLQFVKEALQTWRDYLAAKKAAARPLTAPPAAIALADPRQPRADLPGLLPHFGEPDPDAVAAVDRMYLDGLGQ